MNRADETETDESISKKTCRHLWAISNLLSSTCAAASRFYMFNLEKRLVESPKLIKIGSNRAHLYCNHCGSLRSHGNYSLRIHPCPSLNSHFKKLLKLEAEQPWKLNTRQKKKIKKFYKTTNKIVYTCFVCKKKTVFPGNKTCNIRYRSTDSSKPLSKVMIKKGDLNAGLFIPSPCCSKERNEDNSHNTVTFLKASSVDTPVENQILNKSKVHTPSVTPSVSSDISFDKNKANLFKYQTTPSHTKMRTPEFAASSAQKQSSSKKKKKTLLSQILKQEECSKKKRSLSSFLVSL